ncbi:hypothetical protein PTSG_01221 [Salpingoeca rosetta]|uniref:HEAT repeat protein n=1 Tax=Salpingoeca rosetta (strain ATCC 50818 / BSB-021) TaxID=946362 RepID=F2U159_SALR5|nr:uncharacterized protein PTSG_01221 [Salpingoeca rosetta]EGD80633.1 hypothetical protein PTSG_01221 [Salpingoeca rosetta]|eukprot:XP_004997194.1 hypothetical protein PTSG_01221 [Salpingoeca rosetta]
MPKPVIGPDPEVVGTNGEVDGMVMALIESASDADSEVRKSFHSALRELGKKQPTLVLTSCEKYLHDHKKLDLQHRIILIQIMRDIVYDVMDHLPSELAKRIVRLAADEMTFKQVLLLSLAVVPALPEFIGRCLPMLGMIRHDNMRWVFSVAFSKFCDAILNYNANKEQAKDKSITIGRFSEPMYSAFEVLHDVWLNTKEIRLRMAVIEALGLMTHILGREKLPTVLEKLIPSIINHFKGKFTSDMLPITQGLCTVLDASTRDGDTLLEPQLDFILTHIHPLLSYVPMPSDHAQTRNFNELLRCFEKLCIPFSERLMAFLFLKLEVREERPRIGTLLCLRHLINSSGEHLQNKKELIVTGLKPLLEETNLKVKSTLATLIVAMAHHDYLHLEGGEALLRFIVDQSAIPEHVVQAAAAAPKDKRKKPPPEDEVTPLQLRTMCDNIILMSSRTIPCMELVPVIGQPLHRRRGIEALKMLQSLSINFHENIEELWDAIIPKLVQYLEENSCDAHVWAEKHQSSWEDLLLKFLSRTLDTIATEAWTIKLGEALHEQYTCCPSEPAVKSLISRYIGVVLRKSTKHDFLEKMLVAMFESVDHESQDEREGCAKGFGFCASSHLDTVIEQLKRITKRDMVRKPTGFLGMLKDKSEAEVARIKATIMLTWGYVTLFAPPSLINSRIEVHVMSNILPHFERVRETLVKENLIRCVELIGKALHPSHLKGEKVSLHRRSELIAFMEEYMKMEPPTTITTETRALCMDACATLIELEPTLSESDLHQLLEVSVACVFDIGLPAEGDTTTQALIDKARKSLGGLFAVVIRKDPTTTCLQSVYKHLSPYIVSLKDHQREHMMAAIHDVLDVMFQILDERADAQSSTDPNTNTAMAGFGKLLADFIPRCADPMLPVRQHALGSIKTLLHIRRVMAGDMNETDPIINAIDKLIQRAENGDSNPLFSVVNDLSKVLAKKISKEELLDLIYPLFEGLLDVFTDGGDGACVVINGLFKLRGGDLENEVDAIIDALYEKLEAITQERTKTGVLRAIRTLAVHHLDAVIKKLLSFDLPFAELVVDMWHTLSADQNLAPRILTELLSILDNSLPYHDQGGKFTHTLPPMKATRALKELFFVEETAQLAEDNYSDVLAQLLLRLASCVRLQPEGDVNPMQDAVDAFKQFLERSESGFVADALDATGGWDQFFSEMDNNLAFTTVVAQLCQHKPDMVPFLVEFFHGVMKRKFDTQRVLAVALYAEVINQQCAGDLSLMVRLRNGLLAQIMDESHIVRMLCMRGLGNVASLPDEHIRKHSTAVLSAVMTGMDDRNDPNDDITLEAMRTLNKIFEKVEEDTIRNILINISLRIRPCFEKDKPAVRAAAIELFGNLSQFGDGPSKVPFLEQIHSNLVSFILHLAEDDPDVCAAVARALLKLGPLLESDELTSLFEKCLGDGKSLHYAEFLAELSRVLIKDFRDKVSFYTMSTADFFKAYRQDIRCNAALFMGELLHSIPADDRRDITKEHVCGELVRLLKDPDTKVRQQAAESISLLYDY